MRRTSRWFGFERVSSWCRFGAGSAVHSVARGRTTVHANYASRLQVRISTMCMNRLLSSGSMVRVHHGPLISTPRKFGGAFSVGAAFRRRFRSKVTTRSPPVPLVQGSGAAGAKPLVDLRDLVLERAALRASGESQITPSRRDSKATASRELSKFRPRYTSQSAGSEFDPPSAHSFEHRHRPRYTAQRGGDACEVR